MLREEEGRDEVIETLAGGGKYRMPLYSVQEELGTGVKAKHSRPLIRQYSNAEILSGIISKVNKKKRSSFWVKTLSFAPWCCFADKSPSSVFSILSTPSLFFP